MRKYSLQVVVGLGLGLFLPGIARAQFVTDDSSITEKKHFDLAAGYSSSHSPGKESESFPNITLKYGLNNTTQLSLAPSFVSKYSSRKRLDGLGDTNLAIKWRFQKETKNAPQFFLGAQAKAPTADHIRGLGTGCMDEKFWLTTSKSFKRYKLIGQVGYNFLGGTAGENNAFYGVTATYQATEHLVVGAEFYGNSAATPGKKQEMAWDLGLKYNYAPDRYFKMRVGRSMEGYSDLNLYAAFGFVFK